MTRRAARGRSNRGQATVEFALVIPLLVLAALLLIEVGLVARDRIALEHATRAAARSAIIDPRPEPVARAARSASALDPARLDVRVEGSGAPGTLVTIVVTYRTPIHIPALRLLPRGPTMESRLTAFVEHPPYRG